MKPLLFRSIGLLGASFLASSLMAAKEARLFDGRTLDGWQNFGGGHFYVEDGAIVGETKPGLPNSFLATKERYANFDLTLEFKIDARLNSGIQIRSDVYAKPAKTVRWGGTLAEDGSRITKEMTWEKGRFWGYQVEIDPTERAWTGAIYEEAGRGFLHLPAPTTTYRPGQWNRLRVIARGNHLQTWINGVPVAEVRDDLTANGYIALQLHGIGKSNEKAGLKVYWRDIVLKPL